MKIADFVTDFIGIAGIATWVGFSGYFLFTGNGDFFQRMGAFGVAVAVLFYAFVRRASPLPQPLQQIKDQHWNREMFMLQGRNIHMSMLHSSFLAEAIASNLRAEGKDVPQAIATLVTPLPESETKYVDKLDLSRGEAELKEVLEDLTNASVNVEKQKSISQMIELWIVVIATIQWGFGDLLVAISGQVLS